MSMHYDPSKDPDSDHELGLRELDAVDPAIAHGARTSHPLNS